MKIISSQEYIDWDLVEAKKAQMIADSISKITLTCWEIGEIEDAGEVAILSDGHHQYQAARQLGIEVEWDIIPDPEGLTGEAALDARYVDSDYYYVETSDLDAYEIDRIW